MAEAAGAELPVLPDSVLLQVLALLPLRDRLRAARWDPPEPAPGPAASRPGPGADRLPPPRRVCRRWQRLALDRTVWRHVDLSPHRISSQTLWHLVRRRLRDSLRTLRVQGALRSGDKRRLLSPALLAALGERCPHLRRLCLADTDLRPLPYKSLPASITALELSHCEIPAAWFCGALPQLQHLVICDVPAFSDRHLLNVSSQSRLKTLSLWGTYRLTDMGVQRAAPHLGDLEHLVLRHCVIGDSAVGVIGRHMKQLRFLEIGSAGSLTSAGLACLATLQRLEMLGLDLCDKISLGAVIALCRALPQLRKLKLGGARFEDEVVDKIQASLLHCSFSHDP
ncbi:F-box/LRR-repeat protein 12 isoform X1 [Strix uralensis]|uniref:F-box/LRR-repeat protein 12 isoform X1 n=1 Tax=Strix uralensis TaxID=36305 RepID=UPI003DA77065